MQCVCVDLELVGGVWQHDAAYVGHQLAHGMCDGAMCDHKGLRLLGGRSGGCGTALKG